MSRGSKPRWWRWSQSIIKTTARGWSWTSGNWRSSKPDILVFFPPPPWLYRVDSQSAVFFSHFLLSVFFSPPKSLKHWVNVMLSFNLPLFRRAAWVSNAYKRIAPSSVFPVWSLCCEGVAGTLSRDQHNGERSFSLWRALGTATTDLHVPDKFTLPLHLLPHVLARVCVQNTPNKDASI